MNICLFPGKFQPFHTGQLLVVKGMVKTCGRVMIPVCHSGDSEFTKEEVREMITAALLAEDIMDAEIHFVDDCGDDGEWVDRVLELAEGAADIMVWSGKPEVLALFADADVETKEIKHVPGHESEEILDMVRAGNTEFRSKIPAGAIDVVIKHVENK